MHFQRGVPSPFETKKSNNKYIPILQTVYTKSECQQARTVDKGSLQRLTVTTKPNLINFKSK